MQGQTTVATGTGTSGFGGANGDGIYGTATGNLGYGINGFVTNGVSAIGVYGYADPGVGTRYGGFFDNDLGTTGVKTFLIDHPLDPQNKLLKHFSMESPEVLNVYRGNVVLNSAGEGNVTLPDYFEAVNNSNYSYQLTPIGNAAPVFIKSEITNKQFVVAGGNPGQKISWVVYTERNDLYMQQNPDEREAVINKTNDSIGKYMSPQLYGQPAEMGIHYKDKTSLKATTAKTKEVTGETTEKTIEVKQ
ncbi:MAG: hypothetical protein IPN13_22390 [Bacteroidetes bacterium]|nr:hypothetical protein [Bacteroidota bacterium]